MSAYTKHGAPGFAGDPSALPGQEPLTGSRTLLVRGVLLNVERESAMHYRVSVRLPGWPEWRRPFSATVRAGKQGRRVATILNEALAHHCGSAQFKRKGTGACDVDAIVQGCLHVMHGRRWLRRDATERCGSERAAEYDERATAPTCEW